MPSNEIQEVSSSKCFGGYQKVFKHNSDVLRCEMKFGVYLPPVYSDRPLPVFYWLSGATRGIDAFITLSGFQSKAAACGLVVVSPDTSPRGCSQNGDNNPWYRGQGASFYLDATTEPWREHYQMYTYITKELRACVMANFNIAVGLESIGGHSMGGHGAMLCALRNPGLYKSVSAIAPVCNLAKSKVGRLVFSEYLGTDEEVWKDYDPIQLVKKHSGRELNLLVDQGDQDEYFEDLLMTDHLVQACRDHNVGINYRLFEGYDHGYHFISTVIGDHIAHHTTFLVSKSTSCE